MATSNTGLIASIRFHLNQLSASNGHHHFEHLARHLTRARIYSNILPATGPVGAGGDGGRDFETFRAHIASPFARNSRFAQAALGDRRVAFACTLQVKIDAKIRSDVKAILAGGPVDEVVYFCEANLPIGRRRKLQTWAAGLGVELRVFDGVAISEMLSDPEVFWIAQEYLKIPADQMPARSQEADWYGQLRARWRDRTAIPFSQADFFEVKAGIRHATFEAQAKPDLLFWIDKMVAFTGEHAPRPLHRSALYELAVANLRGRGDMTSQLAGLRDYYSDCDEHLGLADLQNAATLLVYAFGACVTGYLDTDEDTLFDWRRRLWELVQAELERAEGPGRRSGLLQVRGHLGLLPPDPESPAAPNAAFVDWHLMLDAAKDAPLYPIEAFCDFLTASLKWGVKQEQLLALAARADEMMLARSGAAAAEKALARAKTLLENDQYIAAIGALHAAKKRWFSGDHLEELLRSFLLLAHCYQQLHLVYAAKYYALAAAYVAAHEQQESVVRLLPDALHLAIDAEDAAGNSFGFFTLLLQAMGAHVRLHQDPLDREKHAWINENLSHLAALLALLRRGQPALEQLLDAPLALWPEPMRKGVLAIVDSPEAVWNQGDWDDLWSEVHGVTLDRPFGDFGPRRQVRWEALGLTWTINFDNTYATTPLAEQFLSALQIALSSHAGQDLGLMPGDVVIDLAIEDEAAETAVTLDRDGPGSPRFAVTVPSRDRDRDQVGDTLTAVATVLRLHSVLDSPTFVERVRLTALEEMFVARPYAEVWRHFVDEHHFFEDVRRAAAPFRPDLDWPVVAHDELGWFQGPGPTYVEAEALESVAKRYRVILPMLRHTLPRLLADPDVYSRLVALHEEGLRDWEILGVLSNVAMNARLDFEEPASLEQMRDSAEVVLQTPEEPDDALDPSLFTAEAIAACHEVYVGAHLDAWRLPIPPAATFAAIRRFMTARYHMREIDVAHDDIFAWPGRSE